MARFMIQPHVRLQEWIAEEHGYFEDEGLDYEFEEGGFAGASSATSVVAGADSAPLDVRSGAFENMSEGRSCSVSAACHWAVNAAATTARDRMWGNAYSVSPAGIFVAPDAPYRHPRDLGGVPVSVGYHSGSHYSAIQGLEPFLDRDDLEVAFAGLPNDRVRLLLDGEVPAANVFGAQYYVLEQLGFRKLLDTTFVMGFLVQEDADRGDLDRYFRALQRAQRDLDIAPERYKRHWAKELPEDLHERVDVQLFGPGERIVFEPYTREMYDETHRWMAGWELFDLQDKQRDYEGAVLV